MTQNRRSFGQFAFASILTLTTKSAIAQVSSSLKTPEQSEFIFFVNETDRSAAQKKAEFLLSQLDTPPSVASQRIEAIYAQGAAALKTRYSGSAFNQRISTERGALGLVRERVFQGIDGGFKKLPNIPAGEYLIVVFATIFQNSSDIYTEQITLARNDTSWQFVEYFIAKKPYYSY
ncbi:MULTISPECIES: DUF4019 domain-containing protein [unclassified Undibacterium]|uniref:DUF4019 domain-containing protein n=1 Tax=unclassified Undibacterium TaxID=2630295 RepID=UPI002AC8D696|nr:MULTISPECIES: DUF4019 domain-containing protein [unclassified Undibacterium]MEB0141089.1 DUF4019 domain-containing protein [Undibacterium sp. CCC2.1]MEB0174106.1 DUF4019 domain-containing protein [Undibacterium sp. CCC1.1]MEB0178069.1 DUF4019 domain-containing protein [Undibacterium sp. CCC3.4]MEB0217266.1 DUF4019 domain-containing protein [Undibacterium sp. 5I2]WPX43769.1 DUF4019 domain-containing protein [Undibacterium sp. CCC3.4]